MRISDWSSDVCSSDLVKGFEEPVAVDGTGGKNGPETERAPLAIAQHMFKTLRGSNNLVFPNSRREVERYTHLLNELCDRAQVQKELWPHHGNLSKEIPYETEAALKQREHAPTAVCTTKMEMGIDQHGRAARRESGWQQRKHTGV